MIRIDDTMLDELGLGDLPEEEKKKLKLHIYETLEMRVGMSLAQQMSDDQLDEFEQIIDTAEDAQTDGELDSNTQKQALQWLEQNFPDYKKVVQEELEKLKAEVKQNSAAILSSAQE